MKAGAHPLSEGFPEQMGIQHQTAAEGEFFAAQPFKVTSTGTGALRQIDAKKSIGTRDYCLQRLGALRAGMMSVVFTDVTRSESALGS